MPISLVVFRSYQAIFRVYLYGAPSPVKIVCRGLEMFPLTAPVDLSLTIGVAGELRPRACVSRGQCDHQKMVAYVVRHETKARSKLREFLFGAQDAIFRATRTVGMEHRIRRSAEELPTMFPEHDRRHAPGARCQADPLDSTSLCRSAASTPHW